MEQGTVSSQTKSLKLVFVFVNISYTNIMYIIQSKCLERKFKKKSRVVCCYLRTVFVSVAQAVSNKLMAGFVECLDNEEAEEGTEKGDGERDVLYLLLVL